MNRRILIGPVDGLGQQVALCVEGLSHLAAGENHAHNHRIANSAHFNKAAAAVFGNAGCGEPRSTADDNRIAVVIGPHHTGSRQADRFGRGQGRVDENLFPGNNRYSGIRTQPGDAAFTDLAAGHNSTEKLDIFGADQIDSTARGGGIQGRGGMNVEAGAVGVGTAAIFTA